jgi:hypothetical protein
MTAETAEGVGAAAAGPERLTLAGAAIRVFDLSLGMMLWSRRSLFLGLLVGAPVALAILVRLIVASEPAALPRVEGTRVTGPTLFGVMIWLLYLRFIVPVLGVFYGTALIADEVDDRTITYLFVRPIPRGAVLLGKYFAYLVSTVLLVLPSVMLLYFVIVPMGGGSLGRTFPSLMADLGLMAIGLAAYGAVFALVGARLKRPLIAGLVFAFGWEPATLLFPGSPRKLTVAYYLHGLAPHALPADSTISGLAQMFQTPPSIGVSLVSLAAITTVALWLAIRAVERREYVLEP